MAPNLFKKPHFSSVGGGFLVSQKVARRSHASIPCAVRDEKTINTNTQDTLLLSAVKEGDLVRVKELLRKGAWINARDESGYSPLSLAIRLGHNSMVEFLLKRKASIKITNNHGLSPLDIAIKSQNLSVVMMLINLDSVYYLKSDPKLSPLHLLVYRPRNDENTLELLRFLISQGVPLDALNREKQTPLNLALRCRNISVAMLLIESGASVNHVDSSGYAIIHHAVKANSYEVMESLLLKGALVNAATIDNKTALHLAADEGSEEICKCLLKHGAAVNALMNDNATPLHFAADRGNIDTCKLLIESGSDVNAATNDNTRPLHFAAQWNKEGVCKLLLESKADIDTTTNDNMTPIYFAIKSWNEEVSKLLLESKANVNILDIHGKSPLRLAAERNSYEFTEMLLKYNADANLKCKEGLTPLYFPAMTGNEDLFCLLVQFGAKIDVHSNQNVESILRRAVDKGFPRIVEHILKCVDSASKDFKDLLKVAVLKKDSKYRKIARLLVDYGFHFDSKEVEEEEVVLSVVSKGYVEIFGDIFWGGINIRMELDIYNLVCKNLYNQTHIIKSLLKNGADVIVSEERSLLFYAVYYGFSQIVQRILPEVNLDRYSMSFCLAVWSGNFEIINIFLRNGYDINFKDEFGRTVLHYIVDQEQFNEECFNSNKCSREEMAQFLLTGGADVNAATTEGMTVFMAAVNKCYLKLIEMCLRHNADANCKFRSSIAHNYSFVEPLSFVENFSFDSEKPPFCRPLHIATSYNNTAAMKLLLNFGAVADCKNERGLTPLHIAVCKGNFKSVELLLTYGASVNCGNKDGMTPLHFAALIANVDIFQMLLDSCSDLQFSDKNNRTLIDCIKKGAAQFKTWRKVQKERSFLNMIQEHVVKLEVAGLFRKKISSNSLVNPMASSGISKDFKKKCRSEIAAMRKEKFCDSSLSVHDTLIYTLDQLVAFLKNKNFQNVCKTAAIMLDSYVIYGGVLQAKLTMAESKRKLLDDFTVLFSRAFCPLPEVLMDKIIWFFADDELRRVVTVCQPQFNVNVKSE